MSGPVAESKKIGKKLDAMRAKHLQGTTIPGVPQPAPYFEEDPRDRYMEARKVVAKDIADKSGIGYELGTELPVGEKEIKYLLDQELKTEKKNFSAWKYKTYKPGSDPVKLKFYQAIDPSFFKEREAQMEKDFEVIQKLALISLNGVQSEEDLMLLYGINMGKIPIPNWKVHMPFEHGITTGDWVNAADSAAITQGYFNPKRYSITYTIALNPDMNSVEPLITAGPYDLANAAGTTALGTNAQAGSFTNFIHSL